MRRQVEEIRVDMKEKIEQKVETVEEVLRVIDQKVEFVVQSCDSWVQAIYGKIRDAEDRSLEQQKDRKLVDQACIALSTRI